MSVTKTISPSITIDGKQCCINVGRDVVRALGNPDYICILKSDKQHTIAIKSCDDSVALSFKVPERFPEDRMRKLRIYSQKLVTEIMNEYGLELSHSYTLKGEFDEKMNAVIFRLDESRDCTRK